MTGLPNWINIDGDPLIKFRFALAALRPLLVRGMIPFSPGTFDHYINSPQPPNFLYWNLGQRKLPFAENSVAAAFSSHTLEHFPRNVALRIATDVHRVLCKGGLFRVAVPSLELLARKYLVSLSPALPRGEVAVVPRVTARDVNSEFYRGRIQHHIAPRGKLDTIDFDRLYTSLFGVRGHMYMYDFQDLRELLAEAGFRRVEPRTFAVGECPDVAKLDNRPTETLFVEAFRGND